VSVEVAGPLAQLSAELVPVTSKLASKVLGEGLKLILITTVTPAFRLALLHSTL
jgi:hypothetical protein